MKESYLTLPGQVPGEEAAEGEGAEGGEVAEWCEEGGEVEVVQVLQAHDVQVEAAEARQSVQLQSGEARPRPGSPRTSPGGPAGMKID